MKNLIVLFIATCILTLEGPGDYPKPETPNGANGPTQPKGN